jgi:hypothetical protein
MCDSLYLTEEAMGGKKGCKEGWHGRRKRPHPSSQQRPESQIVHSLYECLTVPIGSEGVPCRVVVAAHPAGKNLKALGEKPGCGSLAEAGRGSGDKCDFWCGIHLSTPLKSKPTIVLSLPLLPHVARGVERSRWATCSGSSI